MYLEGYLPGSRYRRSPCSWQHRWCDQRQTLLGSERVDRQRDEFQDTLVSHLLASQHGIPMAMAVQQIGRVNAWRHQVVALWHLNPRGERGACSISVYLFQVKDDPLLRRSAIDYGIMWSRTSPH